MKSQLRSLASRANISRHSQTANLNSDNDEQGEYMMIDSPTELGSSTSPPVLPFGSAVGLASAQPPELPDENLDEAITASAENGSNGENFEGVDPGIHPTVSQGVRLVSSVTAEFYVDSGSVRRCSSVSHQFILVSTNIETTEQVTADLTNVDMAGHTTTDSTDVEMVGPLGPSDEHLDRPRALSLKRKHH